MKHARVQQGGFTVIEVMVTVIIAAMFIVATSVLYGAITSSSASSRNRSTASDIAYANLRKYVYAGATPSWFTCDTTTTSSTFDDYSVNSSALTKGWPLDSGSVPASSGLPQPATYKIVAVAMFGCTAPNASTPITVISTVTYGSDNLTVTHSSYVGY